MNSLIKIISVSLAILMLNGCAHYNGSYPDNGYSTGYGSYGSYGYPAYGGGGYYGNSNYPPYHRHHHHDRRPPAPGYWGNNRPYNNGYYPNHNPYYEQNNYYNRPQPGPHPPPSYWGNNRRPQDWRERRHDGNWQGRYDHDDLHPQNGNHWQGRNNQPPPPRAVPRIQPPRPNPRPQFTNAPNRPWAGQRPQQNYPQPNRSNWQGRNSPPPQPRPQVIAAPRPPAPNPQINRGNWQTRNNPPRPQPVANQPNRAPAPQRMPGGRQNRQWNGQNR